MSERSVNKVVLIGRLGKDAEQRFTPSGVAVSTYSIATSRRWKDNATGEWKDATDWHNLVHWRSENVSQYLLKGARVYVEGRIQTRSYEARDATKRYVTEIVVEEMILLGGTDRTPPSGAEQYDHPKAANGKPPAANEKKAPVDPPFDAGAASLGITDDDVPF